MQEEDKRQFEELLFAEEKKPSFAKQLFFGRFRPDEILPYPDELPPDEEAFVQMTARFAAEEIDAARIDRESEVPDSVKRRMAELGILGMTAPKELGGGGMSQLAYCRVTETLARVCASSTLFLNVHQSIGFKALMLFGNREQKAKWLEPLARGEIYGAFALTEPNAGSDANGVETEAVYDASNDTYVINGRKQWITNGSIAGLLTVMAQTMVDTPRGREKRVTAFLVTPDMPGFRVVERALDKVGFRGTWTANLAFENLVVPAANILGKPGGGLKVALTVLDYGRTTFGAMCTGVAKECFERAVRHAQTRIQFKRPLATIPMVKRKIAETSALVYAMESATCVTAGLIDADVEDVMLESAIIKVFNSDALWKILHDTMQILGGRSLFPTEPFERMMRDARLNMIGEGSNDVMRAFIGAVGMRDVGMELQGMITSFGGCAAALKSLPGRLFLPRIPLRSVEIHDETRRLAKTVRRFSIAVLLVLVRYREGVVDRQLVLDRIATCAMSLFTMSAVLCRLEKELAAGDASNLGRGRLYCRMALRSIDDALSRLFDPLDRELETLSDTITR
jgi:alkylation response protein AidB-like acyl-CoA dehydrogenase